MSERSLVYRVSTAGIPQAVGELRTFLQQAEGLAVAETRAVQSAVRNRVAARKAGTAEEDRIAQDSLKRSVASRNKDVKEAEKSEKDKAKAAERAEKDKTKTAEREAKARNKAEEDAGRRIVREIDKQLREFETAEKKKTRTVETEAKKRTAEMERAAKQQAAAAERAWKQFEDRAQASMRAGGVAAFRSVTSTAMKGASAISNGMGFNAALDVQDVVAERMRIQAQMKAVAIEARAAGQNFGDFDEDGAAKKIQNAAKKYGISQTDLGNAIDVYSEKGSGATAVENIDRIAGQAKAMNTSAAVVAKLRAGFGISSKVGGKELSEDEKDALVAKMHFVGKTGVFRAEDMAEQSESLFAQFTKNGGDFRSGFDRYLSFANEARKATGSGAMARTSINAVQDAIAKKEGRINGIGVKTRDEDGTQRDFIDVIEDVIVKTGGKGDAFNKIFDPAKSGKAISTMLTAFQGAGGDAAGTAAMDELLMGDASLKNATVAEMDKDTAASMESEPAKMARAIEEIRQSLADTLAPAIKKFSEMMPGIVEYVGKALGFVKEHPIAAATILGTASFLKTAVPGVASAALRWAGSAGGPFGAAGGLAGAASGGIGNAISQATSTPVYITGAAPGVLGGGGPGGLGGSGLGGLGGGIGAEAALGGGGGAAATFGEIIATTAGPALGAAIVGAVGGMGLAHMLKTGDMDYRRGMNQGDANDLAGAFANHATSGKMYDVIESAAATEADQTRDRGQKGGKRDRDRRLKVSDKMMMEALTSTGGAPAPGTAGLHLTNNDGTPTDSTKFNPAGALETLNKGSKIEATSKQLANLEKSLSGVRAKLDELGTSLGRVNSNSSALTVSPFLFRK